MAATYETLGANATDSTAVAVSAGDNTKGSWVEIAASTTITAKYIYVIAHKLAAGNYLIDIGTGAAAAEVVVVPDLQIDSKVATADAITAVGPFRLDIASGTRIAARAESDGAGDSVDVQVILSDSVIPDLTSPSITTYGSNSGGGANKATSVDPGGTANTKGAYSQLTASASATGEHAFLQITSGGNTTMVDANWLLDVATGAAASETVQIADIHIMADTQSDIPFPRFVGPFRADIFQSARVAVRSQCDIIDAADRLLEVSLVVVSGTAVAGGSGGEGPLVGGRLVL